MNDYSKMSDAEIAMRVACSIDGVEVDDNGIPKFAVDCYLHNSANSIKWLRVGNEEFDFFNPCNNPSDAWPIVLKNDIMLNPNCADSLWKAEQGLRVKPDGFYGVATAYDNNPLRAAMIVYLMMKDEEK